MIPMSNKPRRQCRGPMRFTIKKTANPSDNNDFSISREAIFVSINFTSTVDLILFKKAITCVEENTLSRKRLWIFSKGLDLSPGDMLILVQYAKQKFSYSSKVAMVGYDDLTFGLLRMFSSLREMGQVQIMPFKSISKATNWLSS